MGLLKIDLSEAYRKLIAVAEGVKVIYGASLFSADLPKAGDKSILDGLVLWTRGAVEALERLREKEVEFDVVVPLLQTTKDRTGAVHGVNATMAPMAADKDGLFTVNIAPWARLKGVGVSLSGNVGAAENDEMRSSIWNAIVFPPKTPRALHTSMVDWQVRPPIILGDVRHIASDRPVSFSYGAAVRNQKVEGEWRVRFLPNAASGTAAATKERAAPAVTDVKLHLKVVAIPLNLEEGW